MKLALISIALLQTVLHIPEAAPEPAPTGQSGHPEASVYLPDRNADVDVERALSDARTSGKTMLLIMGANWCHDSRALAGWFATPRFATMLRDRYEVVYVDVGKPQVGKGRNLDIAKRFGIKKVKSTPLMMLVSPDGMLLNSKRDAISWRNAASRSEADIYQYFAGFDAAQK
jgi:thioredoxin-related protein